MAAMAAPLTRLRSPGRIGFLQRRKDWQFVSIG